MKKIISLVFLLAFLSAAAQGPDFRIMSFNMERGDLSVKKGWGWDVRKEAAITMLQTRRPDILGVQECNSEQRDDILNGMKGFEFVGVSVAGESGEHKTSANYIFYDTALFDLLDKGIFWYAFEPDSVGMYTWIAKKPRNAIWVKLRHKASGREFVYINNHLQNGGDAVINRSMSIMELLSKMREINPDGLPMLYTGDLNSKGIESYYAPFNQEMKEAALTCPITDLGTTIGSYKTKEGKNRIDHIFYSGDFEGLLFGVDRDSYAGKEFVSDHFPVYADFRFTEPQPRVATDYWFDLKPSEEDVFIKAGVWNMFNAFERVERGAPSWNSVKLGAADVIASLGTDIMGLMELTEPMSRDLSKLLKKKCGKNFKFWVQFADPNVENTRREAVGLLYNSERFSVSRQTVSWITASDYEMPAQPWGDAYRILLTAVFTEKASGKQFFVMCGKMARGENPVKYEGAVIKKIEKELNKDNLPCLLLADMNTNLKGHVWLSLLNYWTDTYTLLYPFKDRQFSTRIPQSGVYFESNTPKDWSTKYDIVGISRYVENRILVTEHTVHREIISLDPVPSDHCPVTATLAFK